jgi:glycosyltransferase involved in cell wall biosynthesis
MSPSTRRRGRAPRVSIVLPVHQRRELVVRALAGVRAQTFRDFETIVVDDGSTDGTADAAASSGAPGLRVVRLRRNGGPARARNRALAAARGEVVAFLDSDDRWRPGHLAAMTEAFEEPAVMVAASDFDVVDLRGVVRERGVGSWPPRRVSGLAALAGWERVPPLSTVAVRRRALEAVGGFDAGFRRLCDDSDLLYRLGLRFGPAAFRSLPGRTVAYRRHGVQLTTECDLESGAGLRGLCRRWPALASVQRDIAFDVLRQNHKHRWWVDLVLSR